MSEERTKTDGAWLDPATQRWAVRERYGAIAASSGTAEADDPGSSDCCGSGEAADGAGSSGCCSSSGQSDDSHAAILGYTDEDVDAVADGANLNLGCGNPTAIAGLQSGETVVDLGSGGGFDCFLAAREVGPEGDVIGVDMTPGMIEPARENVKRNGAENIEFRLGEIEHLPVPDASADVVISNCVVNLSPDKPQVYREAYRVLRPGGRLSIADVVLTGPVPEELRADPTAVASCVAGAAPAEEVETMLAEAGFVDVSVELEADSDEIVGEWDADRDLSAFVQSAQITGRKPVDSTGRGQR